MSVHQTLSIRSIDCSIQGIQGKHDLDIRVVPGIRGKKVPVREREKHFKYSPKCKC